MRSLRKASVEVLSRRSVKVFQPSELSRACDLFLGEICSAQWRLDDSAEVDVIRSVKATQSFVYSWADARRSEPHDGIHLGFLPILPARTRSRSDSGVDSLRMC